MLGKPADQSRSPALTGTAGRIGKDDARGSLVSFAKLSASRPRVARASRASSFLQSGRPLRDRAGAWPVAGPISRTLESGVSPANNSRSLKSSGG